MNKINWISEEAYKIGNKEVLEFIDNFMTHQIPVNRIITHEEIESLLESTRSLFRAGYCYYFAHMLKVAFNRGEVCWAAPFGHIVWVDTDGIPYDIEGIYEGEAFYLIPERFLGNHIEDFKHIGTEVNSSKEELIKIMKSYCIVTAYEYDEKVEDYLK